MTFTEKEQIALFKSNREHISSFMSLRSAHNGTFGSLRWFTRKSFKEEHVPKGYIKSLFPQNNQSREKE